MRTYLRLAWLAAATAGATMLAGCGGSYASQGVITPAVVKVSSGRPIPVFHSAAHHYSIHQVKEVFAAQGVPLRNVSPKAYRGLLPLLDGRPTHQVYVYVEVAKFSGVLDPAIRNASVTHHGNVEVLWRHGEKSAVHAALRELD